MGKVLNNGLKHVPHARQESLNLVSTLLVFNRVCWNKFYFFSGALSFSYFVSLFLLFQSSILLLCDLSKLLSSGMGEEMEEAALTYFEALSNTRMKDMHKTAFLGFKRQRSSHLISFVTTQAS
jgi:hypothetical protein